MLSYQGGKSKIGKWINMFIPEDISLYCEPMSGMFWCFFNLDLNKFKNLEKVIYNDVNPLNVNAFNCVKDYDYFSKIINKYESQKEDLYYKFQEEIFDKSFKIDLSKPDYEHASKYAYVLSQCWSGSDPENSKFIDLKGNYKSKYDNFKDKLKDSKWQEHFDKIKNIENLDFEKCIKKYDDKNSFFYLDPPYRLNNGKEAGKYYSNNPFGKEDHKRLAECLYNLKGKFALSYYYFEELETLYPRDKFIWKQKDFSKASGAIKGKEQTKGTELLIMNYFLDL